VAAGLPVVGDTGLVEARGVEADMPQALNVELPDGYEPSATAEVVVEAWPNQETELALEAGEGFDLHEVAAQTEFRGGLVAIWVDGAAIPSGFVGESGTVDFRVQVIDLAAAFTGMSHVTVRYVDSGSGGTWVDANTEESSELLSARTLAEVPTIALVDSTVADTDGSARATAAAACIIWGAVESFYGTKRNVITKVAATHGMTNSTDPGRMVYSSIRSHSTTVGVAASTNGVSFNSYGTDTLTSTWTADPDFQNGSRSWRIEVEYGKYKVRYVQYDDGCGGLPRPNYGDQWIPRYETGGYSEASISRPDPYFQCTGELATGVWKRDSSEGHAYTNSAGVLFKGTIGINLSSESQYATNKRVEYDINHGNRKICGKHAVALRAQVQMVRAVEQG
jgi:hypothetical protein